MRECMVKAKIMDNYGDRWRVKLWTMILVASWLRLYKKDHILNRK